jgi:GTPase SAR1 family protein
MPSLPLSRRELGLIILGNSGVGKSFLANVLLGQEAFVHLATPRAVTTQTEFKEINLGNETFAIFNIPGLIEADQKRIEMNKVEIGKAFKERPISLILYVFGSQGGRIRDEDVVAFNALHKAYPFNLKSLVIIVNGLPKDRPKNYEGEVIVLLEELLKLPCRNLCVLDTIDKNNQDEKQNLKNKIFQVIVERRPQRHAKKQDIELQSEDVRNAKEQIKALQAAFQKNKEQYEEKIQGQQTLYDQMFAKIRNENENMRRLVERQTEEARELKNRILEQEAAYKKIQEQRDAEYREAMDKIQKAHKKEIEEAQRASKLI